MHTRLLTPQAVDTLEDLRERLQRDKRRIQQLKMALDKLAQWPDGEVGPHMDSPWAASVARQALGQTL